MQVTRSFPRDRAERIFIPHTDRIAGCLNAAWSAWEGLLQYPDFSRPIRRSGRARYIYEHAAWHAERTFRDTPGVRPVWVRGVLLLDFDGEALLRFKKLDRWLQTRGVATYQQVLFAEQRLDEIEEQLELWSIPPAPMFVAGYVLNPLETAFARLVIVHATGPEIHYTIELPVGGSIITHLETDWEAATAAEPAREGPLTGRVRSKKVNQQEEGKEAR